APLVTGVQTCALPILIALIKIRRYEFAGWRQTRPQNRLTERDTIHKLMETSSAPQVQASVGFFAYAKWEPELTALAKQFRDNHRSEERRVGKGGSNAQ